jgi:hypothetical protein
MHLIVGSRQGQNKDACFQTKRERIGVCHANKTQTHLMIPLPDALHFAFFMTIMLGVFCILHAAHAG